MANVSVGQPTFQLSASWAGDKIALSTILGYMTRFGVQVMRVTFRWQHLTVSAQFLRFLPGNCDRMLRGSLRS